MGLDLRERIAQRLTAQRAVPFARQIVRLAHGLGGAGAMGRRALELALDRGQRLATLRQRGGRRGHCGLVGRCRRVLGHGHPVGLTLGRGDGLDRLQPRLGRR